MLLIMKTLIEYLNESLNESKEKFVRFKLYGCDDSKKAIEDISSICQRDNIYFEKIDDGFKVKVKEGQNVEGIVNELNNLIENVPEDKKEELADKTESIKSSIEKLQNAVLPQTSEEE